jgi:hypothetical protein
LETVAILSGGDGVPEAWIAQDKGASFDKTIDWEEP